MPESRADHLLIIASGGRGHYGIDQTHGGFVQEATGFAVVTPLNYSAGWGSGSRCDACQLERHTVDGIDVPAGPGQYDWPVWNCAVEILACWLPLFRHVDLVEAPAQEPLPCRQLPPAIADGADQRFK